MFELKPLPDTLNYAYLDEKEIYHVIISANLLEHEEKRLLKTPRKHRAAIGYTLVDIKGISPTLCQHKINMEPNAKPVVDQRKSYLFHSFHSYACHFHRLANIVLRDH